MVKVKKYTTKTKTFFIKNLKVSGRMVVSVKVVFITWTEILTKEAGSIMASMVKVRWNTKTALHIRVNGRMIKGLVKVEWIIKMGVFMREIGKMMWDMVSEFYTLSLLDFFTWGCGKMIEKVVTEFNLIPLNMENMMLEISTRDYYYLICYSCKRMQVCGSMFPQNHPAPWWKK